MKTKIVRYDTARQAVPGAHGGNCRDANVKNATGHRSLELTIRTCAANNGTLSEVPGSNNPPANLLPKARPVLKRTPLPEKGYPDACLPHGKADERPTLQKHLHSDRNPDYGQGCKFLSVCQVFS